MNFLYESTLAARERGLEWPPCRTLISPSSCHEEEHNGLVMMHVDSLQKDRSKRMLRILHYLRRRIEAIYLCLPVVMWLQGNGACDFHQL